MTYTPSRELLEKYANVLVNYALGGGKGLQKGEVVQVTVPECAKPFYVPLRNAILSAGGHPIMQYIPMQVENAAYFKMASNDQLDFFATQYYKGIIDQVDHTINILSENDKHEMEGVDPKKLIRRSAAMKPYREWREHKESHGKFTWTLALYGTEEMATEVGMSLEEYWDQIIRACFLDTEDPIKVWREKDSALAKIREKLNLFSVEKFHVEGEGVDLWVGCGPNRQWLGGGGRNIPSFELFISPDWRGTEGRIAFNQPLYYMGSVIEGISLKFEKGHVVEATATRNEALLKEMIAAENADKIGEFSLTDKRFSRITHVMGEVLYDENIGGEQGNTHVALGNAYKDSYPGDASKVTQDQWKEWGFNQSVIHTDIISTTRRKVTAYLTDGTKKVIYLDGEFQV
jgi:aminopeptidase